MHYFFYSISIIFLSMAVGVQLNNALKKREYYTKLSNLQLIKSKVIYKIIGVNIFKWILSNTFFSRFNPKLKLDKIPSNSELKRLRKEMTYSELSHFIAFLLVAIIGFYLVCFQDRMFGIILLALNVLMNLYPSLLQQKNKSRIDKLI